MSSKVTVHGRILSTKSRVFADTSLELADGADSIVQGVSARIFSNL
ncbi:hypothetical protein [Gordonia sp. C13]|nr:hypothetical protein [Gordonia sp. C13]MCK8614420.1 hypothetical protein [Gordonia sp. C13]